MPIGLEEHLIDPTQWDEDLLWRDTVPKDIQAEMFANPPGAAFGLGKHPTGGWFVLATQGQGPVIIWAQWDGKKTVTNNYYGDRVEYVTWEIPA